MDRRNVAKTATISPRSEIRWLAPVSPDLQADLTVEQMREVCALTSKYRKSAAPFEIVQFGTSSGPSSEEDAHKVAAFAKRGVTWWFEARQADGINDCTGGRSNPLRPAANLRTATLAKYTQGGKFQKTTAPYPRLV